MYDYETIYSLKPSEEAIEDEADYCDYKYATLHPAGAEYKYQGYGSPRKLDTDAIYYYRDLDSITLHKPDGWDIFNMDKHNGGSQWYTMTPLTLDKAIKDIWSL